MIQIRSTQHTLGRSGSPNVRGCAASRRLGRSARDGEPERPRREPEVRRAAGRRLRPRSGFQGRLALASGQPGEHDKAAYRRCVSAAAISIWRRATSAPLSCTAYQSARSGSRPPDSWGPEVPADPHWTCVINVWHRGLGSPDITSHIAFSWCLEACRHCCWSARTTRQLQEPVKRTVCRPSFSSRLVQA